MRSIDSVKKASRKKTRAKPSKESTALDKKTTRKQKKSLTTPPEAAQAKRLMLWILVGGTMVIVIVGWLFFLRGQISGNLNKGGGFQEISKGFKNIFQSIDSGLEKIREITPLESELTSEEDLKEEKIRALEKKAFPQFENSNTNNK